MNSVDYKRNLSAHTHRGPSPAIWADCPVKDILEDPGKGMYFFDDFTGPNGLITSPTTEAALVGIPYIGFGSSGATITFSNELGGAIVLTEATDNEAVYLKSKGGAFQISANLGKLWFEARVKVNAITDDQIGFILGLMDDTAMTVVVPLSTAGPPIFATTSDFVGFWGREQDAGAVGSTYKAGGVAGAGGLVVEAAIHQFVADTYVKLGMVFDPNRNNRLYFYVNNEEQAEYKTVPDNTGTDFPADIRLAPMVGMRLGATTSSLLTMDWWRCCQLYL